MCKINYNESPIGTAGVDAFDLGAAATDTSGQVSSIASNCKISGSYRVTVKKNLILSFLGLKVNINY